MQGKNLFIAALFTATFFTICIGQGRSTRPSTKSNPARSSQAARCLEQNLRAEDIDTALPCVEAEPTKPASVLPPFVIPDGEKHLVRELTSYRSGYFLHPDVLRFCEGVLQEIYDLNQNGKRIELIIITGQADGQRNAGILKGREAIPQKCRNIAMNQTINDSELAGLRGCVVWDLLSSTLDGQKTLTGFGWKPDQITDIPDGGPSGTRYRKVTVEVIWNERQ
jgi:hypothetical protein